MAKKAQQSLPNLTTDQLRNEEVAYAFSQIIKDAQHILTPFEAAKYRTIITVDHNDNERYPNLVKEAVCYFWSLTLSKNKGGNLVLYFSADNEAVQKFGTTIFNRMLRSIFKHTSTSTNDTNIEGCVRISADTKDVHSFFYKRFVDGESEHVTIQALDHVAAEKIN